MGFDEFFYEYFVKPQLGLGYATYNPVNTLVYALAALAAAYVIFKALARLRIRVDEQFALAVLPFVVFGALTRVLVDAGMLPRKVVLAGIELNPVFYPFVTPGIYMLTFLVLAGAYLFSRARPKDDAKKLVQRIGIALAALSLLPLLLQPAFFKNVLAIAEILLLAALPYVGYEVLGRKGLVKRTFFNSLAVAGQALDGAATFVGVSFLGYGEQHIVGNLIFALGSPLLFYFVKAAFGLAVAYVASREEESEEKNFVLLLIAILGLGPGLRDTVRILGGV